MRPPPNPFFGFWEESALFAVKPWILSVIFSPSLREKSLPEVFTEGLSRPFSILYYFLKSSRAEIKSKESFLSGKPAPMSAFYPLSLISNIAKYLEESKHLCT